MHQLRLKKKIILRTQGKGFVCLGHMSFRNRIDFFFFLLQGIEQIDSLVNLKTNLLFSHLILTKKIENAPKKRKNIKDLLSSLFEFGSVNFLVDQ